ncbi:uncharacterized protein LOC141594474 [Silene latifolia]|uniref:uncharacterized protein LOC141594474 n=1 Tax=Silene latifolia TaxID=37657 RepID=UPI003D7798DD
MSFTSDDYGKESVANEISINKDGYIAISKKGSPGYYWTCLRGKETVTVSHIVFDTQELFFEVVRVKDEAIALRNVKSGKFCRRGGHPTSDLPDYLSATATSIIKEAQFQVVETVFSRSVQVLDFDLDKSRIYNMEPIISDIHTFDNPTNKDQEASMNLTISTTKTTTWNNNISVGGGVETSFKTGISYIAEGKITVSVNASYSHEFGGTSGETQQVGDTYTVKVPPFKRVTGRGMATKGTCDVPFTYTQVDHLTEVDHLTDGSTIRTTLSDGVFTGVNAYNFYHDVHYEDVPEELKLKFSQLTTSTD